jgi:anti-sigma regulatory factor (Ser/Thr protein kinase)
MQDISLHLLDIIENSVRADAELVEIGILIDEVKNLLDIRVKDDGKGMDEDTINSSQNPFYTTKAERKKKVGLGIPLFKQNAEQCNGSFKITSKQNEGTEIIAQFQFDHIDRMPLGNIADTVLTSILGHPETDFALNYERINNEGKMEVFDFNTKEVRKELGDVPLNYPEVTSFISGFLTNGINNIYMEEI